MPAQPRADSGGHSEKTNFITGQFKPHPTDAVTRKSRPIGATREAARCSSAVALEGISAARARFPDARAAPMIGGSLVGHGHPPGSSRRSVPAKTAGAILAIGAVFSLTRAVKGHMTSPWTVRTTPAVSVHVRVAFRRGRGICGCIELI